MKKLTLDDLVKEAMGLEHPEDDMVVVVQVLRNLGVQMVRSDEIRKICQAHQDVLTALEIVEEREN